MSTLEKQSIETIANCIIETKNDDDDADDDDDDVDDDGL